MNPIFRNQDYDGKLAGELVKYAAIGLPLTSQEVRFIQEQYQSSIDVWNSFEYWDLWDPSIPDGVIDLGNRDYYPYSDVAFENMTIFLEYCASPYLNQSGVAPVDCDLIQDMENW